MSDFGFRIKATGQIELDSRLTRGVGEFRIAEFRAQRQKVLSHAGGGAGEAECDSDDD